jgi:TDG/mug DNA glycosylase family protein
MAILPDVLDYNLKVVFCGTTVSEKSAKRKAYYANPTNKFWRTLFEIGLTPRRFDPPEYNNVIEYHIGLTDLVKQKSGNDDIMNLGDYDQKGFRKRMEKYNPFVVAFNGKNSGEKFLRHPVNYGKQKEKIGESHIFVLPSTSGAANKFWDISYWQELARFIAEY